LSKTGGSFDRDTDSLEALREAVDASGGSSYLTEIQGQRISDDEWVKIDDFGYWGSDGPNSPTGDAYSMSSSGMAVSKNGTPVGDYSTANQPRYNDRVIYGSLENATHYCETCFVGGNYYSHTILSATCEAYRDPYQACSFYHLYNQYQDYLKYVTCVIYTYDALRVR